MLIRKYFCTGISTLKIHNKVIEGTNFSTKFTVHIHETEGFSLFFTLFISIAMFDVSSKIIDKKYLVHSYKMWF